MFSENSKIVICLDSFSEQIYNSWVIFRLISSVFETTALLDLPIYSIFLWLLLPDLIGPLMTLLQLKPRYGPTSAFLMNIFFSLKKSRLFILICYYRSWCCAVWWPSPALIFSADYILLLAL